VALQTEFAFTLPKGYVGSDGSLHRRGVMRLSTARDEIEPLRDPRITGPDDPYLTILVIGRVIKELGSLPEVTAREVEGLFAADLAFLQDLYGIINFGDPRDAVALQQAVLPVEDDTDDIDDADETTDVIVDDGSNDAPVVDEIDAEEDDAPPATPARSPKADKPVPTASRKRGRIEEIPSNHAS